MNEMWEWLLELGLAAMVGTLIGGERESRGHPAGARTQALVALAAALLTAVGETGFVGAGVDFSRIASQVVTGVGFIGAGVILKHRGTVVGLTTAATLFLSAGLGVAIGAGLIAPALIATGIALLVIYGLRLVKPLLRKGATRTVRVEYIQGHGTFAPLLHSLQSLGGTIQDLRVEDHPHDGKRMRVVSAKVVAKRDVDLNAEMEMLKVRPEVKMVEITAGG